MLKRFLIFIGDNYYPNGGSNDFKNSFDTIQEAKDSTSTGHYEWAHIIDASALRVAAVNENGQGWVDR